MTCVTLVYGASSLAREQAIALSLDPALSTAVLLEGFPSGNSALENRTSHSNLRLARIAAGCMCCTGNLVLRVTLNRLLRDPPQQLFLSISDAAHVEQLRKFLITAPYDALLNMGKDCSL